MNFLRLFPKAFMTDPAWMRADTLAHGCWLGLALHCARVDDDAVRGCAGWDDGTWLAMTGEHRDTVQRLITAGLAEVVGQDLKLRHFDGIGLATYLRKVDTAEANRLRRVDQIRREEMR